MANKYQVVDEILKNQGAGTYNVTFTNLNITDTENTESVEVVGAITEAVKDMLQISYSNIADAPALPEDSVDSPCYEGETGARTIKGFKEVAFTGSYDSLVDAPGIPDEGYENGEVKNFNAIAFTGVTSLEGVQVSEILDLRGYNNSGITTLGLDDAYVNSLPDGLLNNVGTFYTNFNQNKGKKPYFVITNAVAGGKVFSVLQISRIGPGGADGFNYYKIDVANINSSVYPYELGVKGNSVLENIELTSKLGCFIFDINNTCAYYKTADVNANIDLSELADVATSGDYDDLDNKPILDVSDQNSDITGLADVAISGSFDDLENTACIVNFSTFTYQYDELNDSFSAITGTAYDNIYSLGLSDKYIENIDKIYNGNDENAISLKDALLNLNDEFFNENKKCKFITNYNQEILIENIQRNYSGQNLNYISIISIPIISENYTSLTNGNTYTKQQILDQYFYSLNRSVFVCDFNTNTIYIRYNQFYPVMSSDYSITTNGNNIIAVNISSKANNQLQLLTTNGEEGLYI